MSNRKDPMPDAWGLLLLALHRNGGQMPVGDLIRAVEGPNPRLAVRNAYWELVSSAVIRRAANGTVSLAPEGATLAQELADERPTEKPSQKPLPKSLTTEQIRELYDATLYSYEAGEFPEDCPDWMLGYTAGDGGRLNTLKTMLAMSEKLDQVAAFAEDAEWNAIRWESPLAVPGWVGDLRAILVPEAYE